MKPRIVYRPLHGILLLDKPAGLSSNNALQAARRLLRAEKGGHTGSLDPLATGLLPLCFGEATKIAGLLLGSAKAYDAEIVLGVTTDTDDADGEPLRVRAVPELGEDALRAALLPFVGRIQQQAPIYSALKQGGEPLYAKARRGDVIEAPVREVEVQAIEMLGYGAPRLQLRVTCGSGTYIRSLARDLGEVLGCGAHIASLRRRWVEPFRAPQMITLDQLAAALETGTQAQDLLLPIQAGLADFAQITLDEAHATRFRMGQRLRDPAFPAGQVAVFGPDGSPSGLGLVDADGRLSPQRLFNGLNQELTC
ncbi:MULTISPECIES: tRNA pseudouridine(55) synthase TruB [Xanthomonas]|uniref:tRNA pseudouridine(55) synthase TruB n=1 Tax=Xanthomonas cannabis TaxID=1885674 RepID=UPI0005758751|nr:tRNA pseudouridine(55) synthase TruB [Xanthomonas cannabis]KHL57302.1 tRNA pseudouridine synthase B [Xanthomonas cannabis pv. cannabis]KHL60269.1 tRNA pseudouridine synthase B [Xanthomonas cannabis pv. cannabis]MCC4611935.1 tRNA pseudouridine(55) synthase TruB [Xanthomonas campestris pv. esculenti]